MRIRGGALAILAVMAAYAAIVVLGAAYHEPWRDEVVPLSIARDTRSLHELLDALRFEGHPALWYLVLRYGWAMVRRTWVLKLASVTCAIVAMLLWNRGPVSRCLRVAFTFSFFPLYQYSVVSRSYSLAMMLLFAVCALYPARWRHLVALAVVLAALANTEAFGFIIAVATGGMLAVELAIDRINGRLVAAPRARLAMGVLCTGLAVAGVTASPAAGHPLSGFRGSGAGHFLAGVAQAIIQPARHPATFVGLPYPSVWLWAYFAYLLPSLPVFCFAIVSLVGIEALWNVVYGPAAPWHTGTAMLALVASIWIAASDPPVTFTLPARLARARVWLGRVLAVVALVLFVDEAVMAFHHLRVDLAYDYSANRAFATILHDDPALARAVVMGEPDEPLWSLPYYADNRIYLAREGVFRRWGIFWPARARTIDLGELLAAARRVRAECGCPVVIALGWRLDELGTFTNFPHTYAEEHFTITAEERDAFARATRLRARLGPTITDENYDVYVLR